MIAQSGSTYAQILNGQVHWIFTAADLPEWNNDDCPAVEITSLSPQPQVGWLYDGANFIAPSAPVRTLAQAQADQAAALNAACKAAIYTGFQSSALGAPHTYPAKDTDQQNLIASVTDSLYPNLPADWTTPFWCADAAGNWAYLMHTAVQIQQAGADGKAAILAQLAKNATLQAQVAAATSIEAVNAITWS